MKFNKLYFAKQSKSINRQYLMLIFTLPFFLLIREDLAWQLTLLWIIGLAVLVLTNSLILLFNKRGWAWSGFSLKEYVTQSAYRRGILEFSIFLGLVGIFILLLLTRP